MAHSLAQPAALTCPACHHAFTADVWLVVDTAERPDLLARLRAGTLHAVPCPHCEHSVQVDAPLLVYTPEPGVVAQPLERLLFSPAQGTSGEQDEEQARALLGYLADTLGDAWDDALLQAVAQAPRPLLPAALSDDPAAALEQLRDSNPEAFRLFEELAQRAVEAGDAAEEAGQDDDAAEEVAEEVDGPALPPGVAAALQAIVQDLANEVGFYKT